MPAVSLIPPNSNTARWLRPSRPAVIHIRLPGDGVLRLDCYAYFIREPRFRQLLAAYVEGPRAGPYRVFRRADLVRAANPSISRQQITRAASWRHVPVRRG